MKFNINKQSLIRAIIETDLELDIVGDSTLLREDFIKIKAMYDRTPLNWRSLLWDLMY